MRLYGYPSTLLAGTRGVAPEDQRQIEVGDQDMERLTGQWLSEATLPNDAVGEFIEVTDQESGKPYRVASAPCGLGCRCACVIVRAEEQ